MIDVAGLTKTFADAEAVSDVSFHVDRGEIVGLLGPNGAGKTTTMRMLTCFVAPTSGTARLAGFDIYEQSLEVRRNAGYLPENVPLYGEMRVDEYLRFRARLKGVPRSAIEGRVDSVAGRCGLGDVRAKVIDHLSKGYRQRVGLADALVNEPPILILDEPTAGLDPNQIRQVRALIRDLGREHTIILSSHILPEVEHVCGRVIIIHHGRIVAQDRTETLRSELGGRPTVVLELKGVNEPEALEAIRALSGVVTAKPAEPEESALGLHPPAGMGTPEGIVADPSVHLWVECDRGADPREDLFRLAVARGWTILGMTRRQRSLEEIFVNLTTNEGPASEPEPGAIDLDAGGDPGAQTS